MCTCVHVFVMRENVYLQALLEAGGLVLSVFGNGGVRAAAFTGPRLRRTAWIPVLISGLLDLSPHLHCMLRIGLHQRLCREQTKVSHRERKDNHQINSNFQTLCIFSNFWIIFKF